MKSKLQQYVCIETLQRRKPLTPGETVVETEEDAPIISAIQDRTVEELDTVQFTPSLSQGTDTVECDMVWSLIGNPTWVSIDASTGEITVTPDAGTFNNGLAWTMQVRAENCAGNSVVNFNIFVTPQLGVYKGQWLSSNIPAVIDIQNNPAIIFNPASTAWPSDDWAAYVPETNFTGPAGEYEWAGLGAPLHKCWIAKPQTAAFAFTSMTVGGFPWALNPAPNTPYCSFTSNGVVWNVYLTANSAGGGFNIAGGNPLTIA